MIASTVFVSIDFYEKVFVFVIKKERGIPMVFKERLKEKRTEANLTQVELAEKAGVTARTIQNYELGSRKPSNMVTIQKIADALNTTTEYLLGSSGTYVVEAHEKGGAKAAKDIEELVSEVTGMFAGGELSEDAIEGAYKALTDAYWIAKENNKKYAPKTRRKIRERSKFIRFGKEDEQCPFAMPLPKGCGFAP